MKGAQLLKIKVQNIWVKGCVCVCVCYRTSYDYPSLVEGESHGIYYYINNSSQNEDAYAK